MCTSVKTSRSIFSRPQHSHIYEVDEKAKSILLTIEWKALDHFLIIYQYLKTITAPISIETRGVALYKNTA
jgi:hypothetical protein